MKHLSKTKSFRLKYCPRNVNRIDIAAYVDASFARKPYFTSQLGMAIFLTDSNDSLAWCTSAPTKTRVWPEQFLFVKSMPSVQLLTFLSFLSTISRLHLGRTFPIHMFIDTKSLFDLVTKASYTACKRLMIIISVIREAFREWGIDNIGHVMSEHNPADSFTNITTGILQKICETGKLNHPVQHWIINANPSIPMCEKGTKQYWAC